MPKPLQPRTARRIVAVSLLVGVLVDVLVPGNGTGINAVLVVAAVLGAAALIAGPEGPRRIDPADSWLPVAALGFAAMPAVRADDWLVTADLLLAATLALGTIACLAGARITRGLVPAILTAGMGLLVGMITGAASVLGAARPAPAVDGETSARDRVGARIRRAGPVLRGLLLAIPIVAVFALLFASADAVFAELARSALDWRIDLDLSAAADRSAWILAVSWAMAGLLAIAVRALPLLVPGGPDELREVRTDADAAADAIRRADAPPPPPWWTGGSLGAASAAQMRQPLRLGTVEAATVLWLLVALFAGFVALQLTYLFGGRDTAAVAGMTYSEYARRGFFELVAVAVLAGTLVVVLDLAVAWRGRAQLAGSIALLGLTGIVLVSAFVRLRLYQDAYGWTELRFVVIVAILWLAVALGLTAWLLLARMTRWTLHVLGILLLITVAGMNLVGPQAFVADRNLERALDPASVPPGGRTGLDAGYLATLGDEAVPALVAAYPALAADTRTATDAFLEERRTALQADPTLQGWPAWNLTRLRARDALAGWSAAAP
ncbi:MAG TPA: DUF4173 domain-containing protein [Candidatus Limnocylindrales bacterium]|nr:DUF4173 domain-containing protein [Candidatus Limnocylindrales bacterium]